MQPCPYRSLEYTRMYNMYTSPLILYSTHNRTVQFRNMYGPSLNYF
jgi:hypothetical protein